MADDKQEVQSGEAEETKTEENNNEQAVEATEEKKEEETPTPTDKPAEAPAPAEEKAEETKAEVEEEKKEDVERPAVDTSKLSDTANKVLDQVSEMTVLELAELVKVMEDKFGVSAAPAAVAVAGDGAGGDAGGGAEEKSAYNINLVSFGGTKIAVIKAVRGITDLGLKEAKDLVDAAPKVIKEAVKKEEAEEIKKKLEEAGATVELI